MRFHKIANVNKALDFITSKGVKLVSIGAEGTKVFQFVQHQQSYNYHLCKLDNIIFRDCGW